MWFFHITFVDPYVAAYISSSEIFSNFHVIVCSICYDFIWLRSRTTSFKALLDGRIKKLVLEDIRLQ